MKYKMMLNVCFFYQPNQKVMDKYINKINIDKYEPITTKLNNNLEISE